MRTKPGGSAARDADQPVSHREENWLNAPNAISLARLCVAPVALLCVIRGREQAFQILIVFALLSDFVDGFLARTLGLTTRIGARLDSIADDATFVVGLIGVYAFKFELLRPDLGWLYVFIVFYILCDLIPYLKFGKMPAFHVYSFKATGYLVALNFLLLFTVGYVRFVFVTTMIVGTLAAIETIAVALALKEFRTDVRGLYWVLADRRR